MLLPLSLVVLTFALLSSPEARAQSSDSTVPLRAVSNIAQITGVNSAKSAGGRDIELISVNANQGGELVPTRRVLIEGGLHGDEVMTTEFVNWLANRVTASEGPLATLLARGVNFDFLPEANPDGVSHGKRANDRGVNLNRNFGVLWGVSRENPGQNSFSEPETRALRQLFKARHYTAAVDVHGYINWIVMPSSPANLRAMGITAPPERSAAYQRWSQAITAHAASLPRYEMKTGAELGDGGAFEDWAFWSQGTFSYCLEIEHSDESTARNQEVASNTTHANGLRASKLALFLRYERFVYRTIVSAINIAENLDS